MPIISVIYFRHSEEFRSTLPNGERVSITGQTPTNTGSAPAKSKEAAKPKEIAFRFSVSEIVYEVWSRRKRIRVWFGFSALFSLLPFALLVIMNPYATHDDLIRTVLGRGDLYLVAATLVLGGMGELSGKRSRYDFFNDATHVVALAISIFSSVMYIQAVMSIGLPHGFHPFHNAVKSITMWVLAVLISFCCLILPEE